MFHAERRLLLTPFFRHFFSPGAMIFRFLPSAPRQLQVARDRAYRQIITPARRRPAALRRSSHASSLPLPPCQRHRTRRRYADAIHLLTLCRLFSFSPFFFFPIDYFRRHYRRFQVFTLSAAGLPFRYFRRHCLAIIAATLSAD
jgi:hypothetical protein